MKILLLGEYSNVHATLAIGLRQLGHEVVVASNGDFWKDYPRDISLERKAGKTGGIRLWMKIMTLLPRLRNFDVVQLINPMFVELKAERIFHIYRYLRRHNKRMFLGGFGMDWYWVDGCLNKRLFRYSDFNIGGEIRTNADAMKERKDWIGTKKEELNKLIANDCDGIITGLYEYWACYKSVFPDKTTFVPFPIITQKSTNDAEEPTNDAEEPAIVNVSSQQSPSPLTKMRIFVGVSKGRSEYKGTDIMLRAAQTIVAKYPDKAELVVAEGVPFAQYQKMMDGCDIILDQLYSYTPGMNALLAMSKGIVCVGGGEEEHYDVLCEKALRPIINVQPEFNSVCRALEDIVLHPERFADLRRQSIEYVAKHHDCLAVARQYEEIYKSQV